MTDNKKEEKDLSQEEINLNLKTDTLKLIGNKRERGKEKETTDEDKTQKTICNCCGSSGSEQIIFSQKIENTDNIIELFSKGEEFMILLKENFDNLISKNDFKINNLCGKCLLNEFIKGGTNKIISQKNSKEKEKEKNTQEQIPPNWDKKAKELMSIYSFNLNYAITELKVLKDEFLQITKNVKEIFDSSCIQIMFSKNKEPFPDLKRKVDNCDKNIKDIKTKFDTLLKNLTTKEEMKSFVLNSVIDNSPNQRNDLLKLIKQMETDLSSDIIGKNENNNNINKNNVEPKKENYKKNINEILLLNNNELLKNNLLFSQNNLLNNAPNLFNSGFGILPLGMPTSPSNNILLNNLMLNPALNPSILNQINNTINLNSMLSSMNNNNNDVNNNLSNFNNLSFPGLNNLSSQNINPNVSKTLESILLLRNYLNSDNMQPNPNNMMNNLYQNQVNPNLMSPVSLNNFLSQNSQIIQPNLLNNNNNNLNSGILNNNFSINENNLMNRKIPSNEEKSMTNTNPNINNNINVNANNIKPKEIKNIINNNNNINETNNNINKIYTNNQNNQIPNNNECILIKLFDSVAAGKEKSANLKNATFPKNIAP